MSSVDLICQEAVLKAVNNRACEKKSVNSVFYDYIFTYPAL